MQYQLVKLENGLRVILAPMKETETATIMIMNGVGSRYETEGEAGLSHFIEHMFFKGTEKYPDTLSISGALDAVGGEYNAFTAKDKTNFYAKVPTSKFEVALDIISDIFLHSKIESEEIEKEKGTIIQEINLYEDTPMTSAPDLFENLLWPEEPLGRDIIGTKETVKSFHREDFIKYIDRHYVASDTVVCVAGKFELPWVLDKIKEKFSSMPQGEKPVAKKVEEKQMVPMVKIKNKKTDQTHLVLGVRAYGYNHPDRFVLSLLSIILGGNMSSRLFLEVREKRGLAYYVRTNIESYQETGYLATHAGVEPEKLDLAISTILKEYKKIKDEKVTDKELQKAKDFVKGKSVMNLEASDEVAMFFIDQEVSRQNIMTVDQIMEKIDEVTPADIWRVAQDIFKKEKINLAIIGNKGEEKALQNLINQYF